MTDRNYQNIQQKLLVSQISGIAVALTALLLTANPTTQLALALLISGAAPVTGVVVSGLQLHRTRKLCCLQGLLPTDGWTRSHAMMARVARRLLASLLLAIGVLGAMWLATIKLRTPYAPLFVGALYATALLWNLRKGSRPVRRYIAAAILAMLYLTVGTLGALEVAEQADLGAQQPVPEEGNDGAGSPVLPGRCTVDPSSAIYEIKSGDTLWSIARDELARYESQPSDSEVLELVSHLHELNIFRLVDPENPDLIFPADTLEIVRQEVARFAGC